MSADERALVDDMLALIDEMQRDIEAIDGVELVICEECGREVYALKWQSPKKAHCCGTCKTRARLAMEGRPVERHYVVPVRQEPSAAGRARRMLNKQMALRARISEVIA